MLPATAAASCRGLVHGPVGHHDVRRAEPGRGGGGQRAHRARPRPPARSARPGCPAAWPSCSRAAAMPTLTRFAPAWSIPVSVCARLPVRSASAPSSARPGPACAAPARCRGPAGPGRGSGSRRPPSSRARRPPRAGAAPRGPRSARTGAGSARRAGCRSAGPAGRRWPTRRRGTCPPRRRPRPGCRWTPRTRRPRLGACDRSRSSLPSASPLTTARSSVPSGALLWLRPTTSTLMGSTAVSGHPGGHAHHRPPLRVEGENLQLDGQVDLTHVDPGAR